MPSLEIILVGFWGKLRMLHQSLPPSPRISWKCWSTVHLIGFQLSGQEPLQWLYNFVVRSVGVDLLIVHVLVSHVFYTLLCAVLYLYDSKVVRCGRACSWWLRIISQKVWQHPPQEPMLSDTFSVAVHVKSLPSRWQKLNCQLSSLRMDCPSQPLDVIWQRLGIIKLLLVWGIQVYRWCLD